MTIRRRFLSERMDTPPPVSVAPEISVPSQLYGVGPGSDVTIVCHVQAYPSAINYWMRDQDEMLLDGAKYNISEERKSRYETVMYLTIRNWRVADESHFTCISTNSLGKADGRIQSYSEYCRLNYPENILRVSRTPVYK